MAVRDSNRGGGVADPTRRGTNTFPAERTLARTLGRTRTRTDRRTDRRQWRTGGDDSDRDRRPPPTFLASTVTKRRPCATTLWVGWVQTCTTWTARRVTREEGGEEGEATSAAPLKKGADESPPPSLCLCLSVESESSGAGARSPCSSVRPTVGPAPPPPRRRIGETDRPTIADYTEGP